MKAIKKEDALYWVILGVIILILYFVFSDGQFSLIFTLAGTVQTFGFALIVIKINRARSVTGLSRETFFCYAIIFGIRAVLFLVYKVRPLLCRAIFPMIQLEMLSLGFKNLQQPFSQHTSSTASSTNTKRRMTATLILSNRTIWL